MTSTRKPLLALVSLIALAVLALPAAAFGAGSDPDPGGETHDQAQSDAIDIALIAQTKGWTVPATRAHMTNQRAFGDLQQQIELQFPAQFSGAEFAAAPGGKSFLRFKGAVPAAATELASASGLNVRLTGGRRFSADELASRTLAVLTFINHAGYTQAGAAVLPDGTIETSVTGVATPGFVLPPSLRTGVHVTFVPFDVAVEMHTYGGAKIDSSSSQCTTGFSVESLSSSLSGVTTAGHCNGMNTYHEPQGGPAYSVTFEDEHIGLDGDIEWVSTPTHLDLAEYYADTTDRREVNTVETTAAVNNTYCLYSRMQGNRYCDQVFSTYLAELTTNGLASNLVGMDDTHCVHGDSGGPWSYSTEAAGSVMGTLWLPFQTHDTWAKAWLYDNAIDVRVLTQ